MKEYKRILKTLANNHGADPVELLVNLWDYSPNKFDYLKNENSVVKTKDLVLVKKRLKYRGTSVKNNDELPETKISLKEYDFRTVGRIFPSFNYLSKDEILKIYDELVEDFKNADDPIQPAGVKSIGLLDAAIYHASTSYEFHLKYPTVESAAAALMYGLTHNHSFHNGNKRIAMVSMLVFLDRHNVILLRNEDELFKVSLQLADHKMVEKKYLYSDAEIYELAKWIYVKSKVVTKGERPITLKKFKQCLAHFDCEILSNGRVQRKRVEKFLGISKKSVLVSKRIIGTNIHEGQEVDLSLVKSIREDLLLNVENGVDSESFYKQAEFTTSDFINKYKSLLRKLSKV